MSSSTKFCINLFIMFLFHSCLAEGSNPTATTTFTIVNKCSLIVFPGIFHGDGAVTSLPSTTGFSLHPGKSTVLTMPRSWSGSLWGRTHCSHSDGKFSCLTGDCASSTIKCNGTKASPPATLVEFNLNATSSGYDFFDVSVVNGYNLAMMVEAQVGNGFVNCMTRGCRLDLNKTCPSELKVMSGGDCIGCSATQPFPKYSEFFTNACPRAKVDDSNFQISVCASTDYLITFCPTPTRIEPRKEENPTYEYEDNSVSGGEKKGSTNNNIVMIILAVVGCVTTGGTLYFAISCYISYSTKHGCNFSLSAGIRSRWPHFCS